MVQLIDRIKQIYPYHSQIMAVEHLPVRCAHLDAYSYDENEILSEYHFYHRGMFFEVGKCYCGKVYVWNRRGIEMHNTELTRVRMRYETERKHFTARSSNNNYNAYNFNHIGMSIAEMDMLFGEIDRLREENELLKKGGE